MIKGNIRGQLANTVLDVGKIDERLTVLLGDIGHFNMIPFANECSERFYNVGICEPTIISMAAGLSKTGMIPVVHTINPFIVERSFEQLKLDFIYQKLPGNIVTVGSLFDYSKLGCTHHCYGDFSLLKSLNNVEILFPATCNEFDILFRQTYDNDKLTFFRIPEYIHTIEYLSSIQVGKIITIENGADMTVVVTGPLLESVVNVSKQLKFNNFNIDILYTHTIAPFDYECIHKSVSRTKKVLVIEEHGEHGGIGEDVLKTIYSINDVQYKHLCVKGEFIHEYGNYEELLTIAQLDEKSIYDSCCYLLGVSSE